MFSYYPPIERFYTRFFSPLARFLHDRCRLRPHHVSLLGGGIGVIAAFLIGFRYLALGMSLFALSLLLDATDGTMARVYHQESRSGALTDRVIDWGLEYATLAAFASAGFISASLAVFVAAAIFLARIGIFISGIDLGMRRTAFLFAPLIGFDIALYISGAAQLCAFALNAGAFFTRWRRTSPRNRLA